MPDFDGTIPNAGLPEGNDQPQGTPSDGGTAPDNASTAPETKTATDFNEYLSKLPPEAQKEFQNKYIPRAVFTQKTQEYGQTRKEFEAAKQREADYAKQLESMKELLGLKEAVDNPDDDTKPLTKAELRKIMETFSIQQQQTASKIASQETEKLRREAQADREVEDWNNRIGSKLPKDQYPLVVAKMEEIAKRFENVEMSIDDIYYLAMKEENQKRLSEYEQKNKTLMNSWDLDGGTAKGSTPATTKSPADIIRELSQSLRSEG